LVRTGDAPGLRLTDEVGHAVARAAITSEAKNMTEFSEIGAPTTELPAKHVAGAVLVSRTGRLLLQLRDDDPNIDNPGLIGIFGGHREDADDGPLACARREILEETGYCVPRDGFEFLTQCVTDHPRFRTCATLYLVRHVPERSLTITEGALFTIEPGQLEPHWRRMSAVAILAVRIALDRLRDAA